MKLQLQALAGIAAVDALVVVSTVLPGAPVLPMWMAIAACVLTVVAFVLVVARKGTLRVKGLVQLVKTAVPMWVLVLTAVGFYGGWIIALVTLASGAAAGSLKYENGQYTATQRKVVRVLTKEQYEAAQAATQRIFCAGAMAVAAGGVVLGAIRSAAEGQRPRA